MAKLKQMTLPGRDSKPYVVLLVFTILTICLYMAISEVYWRPLHPVSALSEEEVSFHSLTDSIPAYVTTAEPVPSSSESLDPGKVVLLEVERPIEKLPGNKVNSAIAYTTPPPINSPRTIVFSFEPVDPPPACITILLMGVDSRLGGLISRTDTIMLLSVCEEAQTVSLLSIPRDLYVPIPGYGRDRINTALVHGASGENLADGVALVMQTVQQTLNVRVDHYILVDFRAVVRSIDALGGIDVYVPYPINDPTFPDMNHGFDPLYIPEGLHHFNGEMALKYARTRHQDNDFYRARRQQQILFAVRQKVLNLDLTELLDQTPTLYEQALSGIFTDLSLEQVLSLAQMANTIPEENIYADVLDDDYVTSYSTPAGESVLLLLPHETKGLIHQMFPAVTHLHP